MTNSEIKNYRIGLEIKHYADRNEADKKQASKVLDRVIGMLISAKKELDENGYVRESAIWNSITGLDDVNRLYSAINARERMLADIGSIMSENE